MTQLVKILNINVIFLHCDYRMPPQPQLIRLIDSRIVRLDKLQDMVVEDRFDSSLQKKYVYMRHTWYVQKMMECMQNNLAGFLFVRHWSIQSGNRSTFMFDGKLFPNVAYIFDHHSEHWFCARVDNRSNRLIAKELTRKLTRPPPIKEILDQFQGILSQCRLVSYTADKTEIAVLRPYETLQILEQLPLSGTMSPIERTSPTPPRREASHEDKMNNGKFLDENRNEGSNNNHSVKMEQNRKEIKNFLMERMNNLSQPGTSAEAARQDELALRLTERKLSKITRQGRRSLLQGSRVQPGDSPEIALRNRMQEQRKSKDQHSRNSMPQKENRKENDFYKRLYIKWTNCNDNNENYRK